MYPIKRTALQRNAQVIAQCSNHTLSLMSFVPSNGHVNLFPAICTAVYTALSLAVGGKEAYCHLASLASAASENCTCPSAIRGKDRDSRAMTFEEYDSVMAT